jgi:hypothetical protein
MERKLIRVRQPARPYTTVPRVRHISVSAECIGNINSWVTRRCASSVGIVSEMADAGRGWRKRKVWDYVVRDASERGSRI